MGSDLVMVFTIAFGSWAAGWSLGFAVYTIRRVFDLI